MHCRSVLAVSRLCLSVRVVDPSRGWWRARVGMWCGGSLGLSGGLGAAAGRLWCSLLAGYLVDPASSHMLVSKIKPCMSKYKRLYCETANGSLNQQ